MENQELQVLIEATKAQTHATVAQTVVLEGIKGYLDRQKDAFERNEKSVEQVSTKVTEVKVEVTKSIEDSHKKILEKIIDLEYTSKVHWFIVSGGFLGVIVSVVAAIAAILAK